MWTVKTTNWFATVFEILLVAAVVAVGTVAALHRDWRLVAMAVVILAVVVANFAVGRRSRREATVLAAGRARDERQASLQLRAYATVGQVMLVVFIVGFVTEAARGTVGMWTALLVAAAAIGGVTRVILRELDS